GELELVHISERKTPESDSGKGERVVAPDPAETRDGHAGSAYPFLLYLGEEANVAGKSFRVVEYFTTDLNHTRLAYKTTAFGFQTFSNSGSVVTRCSTTGSTGTRGS